MTKFVVREKSGFSSVDYLIKVFDNRGILFYFRENLEGKKITFNLPKGMYQTQNTLYKTSPLNYKLINLPIPNNKKKLPSEFKIYYIKNPHKCSVDNRRHIIYFDLSFKNMPLPVKDYIKFHELGHYFYSGQGQRSEILCDLFAANQMLKVGYNKSQIAWAQRGTLGQTETSKERKEKVFNHIQKTKW